MVLDATAGSTDIVYGSQAAASGHSFKSNSGKQFYGLKIQALIKWLELLNHWF
jgi:hypothetical protein